MVFKNLAMALVPIPSQYICLMVDGAQLTLVVYGLAADPPFAVGIPFVVAYVGLTQRDVVFYSRSRMCVFEHANSRAISRMESRSTRYFCLSTPSGIRREVMQIVDLIDICGMSTDSAQWLL